ncbi:MAG: flavodoxin [Thomasclavelia sp.]|nr:flavodoxin [Thomasclavelia sp.]
MSKCLIIYYSRKGENYLNGSIQNLEKGNTQIVVDTISKAIDVDTFEVKTVKEYSKDYTSCTNEASLELKNNERPQLKEYLTDISKYDSIIIAGPCWWGTYPMAIFSQLDKLDFNGKKIFPIMTHEGSGLGSSIQDLKKVCSGAVINQGLAIRGNNVHDSKTINDWIDTYLK